MGEYHERILEKQDQWVKLEDLFNESNELRGPANISDKTHAKELIG